MSNHERGAQAPLFIANATQKIPSKKTRKENGQ